MTKKNVSLPSGCWRILLALPLLIVVEPLNTWLEGSFRPLLPSTFSDQAAALIVIALLIATLVGSWLVVLKVLDLLFRTTLFPRR